MVVQIHPWPLDTIACKGCLTDFEWVKVLQRLYSPADMSLLIQILSMDKVVSYGRVG